MAKQLGLRTLIVSALIMLSSVAAGLIAWRTYGEQGLRMQQASEQLLYTARAIAVQQRAIEAKSEALLTTLAVRADLRVDAAPSACSQALADIKQAETEFLNITRSLPNGMVDCSAVPTTTPVNISDRPYFRQALKTPAMAVSDLIIGKIVNTPVIIFAKAARNEVGDPTSVFVLVMSMDWLSNKLKKSRLTDAANLIVFDQNGKIAIEIKGAGNNQPITPDRIIQSVLQSGTTGVIRVDDADRITRIVSHTPLFESANSRFTLAISIPIDAIKAPIDQKLLRDLVISFSTLLLALLLILSILARDVLDPLRKLAGMASRIAAGDFRVRSGVVLANNEIGLLASTFDSMAESLEERQQKLDAAVKALKESEARYRRIFENSFSVMLIIDPADGRIVDANVAASRFYGWTLDELRSMKISQINTMSPEEISREMQRARQLEKSCFEFRHRLADGTIRDIETFSSPITIDDRELLYSIVHDITDKLRAESKLRTLSAAIEQSPNSVIIANIEHQIEFVNQAFLRATGYAADEVIGKTLGMLQSGSIGQEEYGKLWPTLEKGCIWKGELQNQRKDGAGYTAAVSIAPIVNPQGQITNYVAVEDDVTEKRQLEAELLAHRNHLESLVESRTEELIEAKNMAEQANQAKSQFLANMSHEIRTPLNGVLGLAQIGFRDSPRDSKAGETFRRILDSANILLAVINDILDFSKIESGRLAVETIPFSPDNLIDNTIRQVEPLARTKGIQLKLVRQTLPEACLGDPVRIGQVALNLLSNAIKFTESGEVCFVISWREGEFSMTVSDTGIGISPEALQRLFQPFEQADSSTTRRFGGTGLGLAISRRLAEIMGGELSASSREGQGSSFTLKLPLPESATPVPSQDQQDAAAGSRLAGLRLLVAEDNAINQIVISDMLRGEKAEVTLVNNGREAVEMVEQAQQPYAAVLMDVQMPEMDGIEATTILHQRQPGLRIIGQTAHAMKEERARCLAAGMIDVISKPIEIASLIEVLTRHLLDETAGHTNRAALTQTTASSPAMPIDWLALEARYATQAGFVERLASLFLSTHANDPAHLRHLADQGKLAEIELSAHAIKGVAGNLSAWQCHQLASETTHQAHERDTAACDSARQLATAMEQLLDLMRQRLDSRDRG